MPLTRPRTALLSDTDGFLNVTGMIKPHSGASAPTGWQLCDGSSLLRASFPVLFALVGTSFGSVDGTHFNVPDLRGRTALGSGAGTYAQSVLNTAVNTGTDIITVVANEHFITGQAVQVSSTGTFPSPLLAATNYFVILISGTTIKLATALTNAQNGTPIDITTQGTGTHTLTFVNFTTRTIGATGGEEAHAMSASELLAHSHTAGTTLNFGQSGSGTTFRANDPAGAATSVTGSTAYMNVMQPFVALNWIIKT